MEINGVKCDYLWLSGLNGCYKCGDWGNCDIEPYSCCLDCENNQLSFNYEPTDDNNQDN